MKKRLILIVSGLIILAKTGNPQLTLEEKRRHFEKIRSFYSPRFFSWKAIINPLPPSSSDTSQREESSKNRESGNNSTRISPADIPVRDGNYSFKPWQKEIIQKVLTALPERFLRGISQIVARNAEVAGSTRTGEGKGTVYLSDIDDPERFRYALLHEIGHTVAFYTGSRELVDKFHKLFGGEEDNYVTSYAMNSPDEDFAETWAKYITSREALLVKAEVLAKEGNSTLLRKVRIIEEILGIA